MIKSRRMVPALVSAASPLAAVKEISATTIAVAIIAGEQKGKGFFRNVIIILRNIFLERTLDLTNFSAPGSNFLLNDLDQPEKAQRENGQDQQDHQGKSRIQAIIGLQDEIAQPFVGGNKFRYESACDGKNDRDFDPGKHERYRIGDPDLL